MDSNNAAQSTIQTLSAILIMPCALLSMAMPLSPLVGLIGIFWHPYDLPTGLNALALAGTSFGIGLVGLMASQGLAALGISVSSQQRSLSDDEQSVDAGSAYHR